MDKLENKLWERIKQDLSIYFDRNIPRWLKTKRACQKEVKRRFIEAMEKEIQRWIKEDEDKILYGDPDSFDEPVGILNAGFDEVKTNKET